MATARTPDQRADWLASRQHALITFEQALSCGLSEDQIHRRASAKRWVRVAKGVYRVAAAPSTWQQAALAACLAGPHDAVTAYLTAAALYRWADPPNPPQILVGPTRSTRSPLAMVHRGVIERIDRTIVGVIPATMPARTLVDVASVVDRPTLVDIADNALCSKLVTASSVVAALERAGRKPNRRLLSLLDDWDPVIRPGSPAEMRALRLLRQWGFGTPAMQHVIRDERGRFVAKVDLAWVRERIAGEYDSQRFHGETRWGRDEPRYAAIERAGWWPVTIDKADLRPGERRLRDDLELAFARRRAA